MAEEVENRTEDDWFPEITPYVTALYIVYGCILGFIALVGLIGNTLSLLVWRKESAHGSTAFLLQALAVTDSFFLIAVFAYFTVPMQMEYFQLEVTKTEKWRTVTANLNYIVLLAKTMTVWMVVFVAIDRYIGVCHPLRATKWCRIRYSKVGVAVLVLCSLAYNAVFWILASTSKRGSYPPCSFDGSENESFFEAISNRTNNGDFASDNIKLIVRTTFFELVHFIIPMIILVLCNMKLCHAIKVGDQIRANMVHKITIVNTNRTSVTVTRTLIMIVVLFLILETPGFILGSIYLTTVIAGPCSRLSQLIDLNFNQSLFRDILKPLSDIMLTTNSSINFFVYCLMVRKFRTVLRHILTCRKVDSPLMPTQGTTSDV